MAKIEGTIRSAGEGVAGLRVTAFEEVRIGFELEHKPCVKSHPKIRQVGEKTTDGSGRFSISYTPTPEPPLACLFSAVVSVNVFDGNTLVWHSPKRPVTPVVRFDRDLQPEPEPPTEPTARIVGRITLCGRAAAGYRVTAFEQVRIGFPTDLKPCQISLPSIRTVGSALVGSDGEFAIDYSPTVEPSGACSFSASVHVDVFDVATLVWRSPERTGAASVRFDHELYPDCPPGSTLVRVVTDLGQRAKGAEVFVNGERRGVSDEVGQINLPGIASGDVLVARLLLAEQPTDRGDHGRDSTQNWSYRTYITSLTLTHDEQGNNPAFEAASVADPTALQELIVRRTNVLVGFNFVVSVEWEATGDDMLNFRDRIMEFSELIFNATDGQFLIERFSIGDKRLSWDEADFRVYANHQQGSNATAGGIAGKDGHARMNPYDAYYPGGWIHEFGHYVYAVLDEYERAECWPEGQPVACTLKSLDAGTEFSEDGSKDACLMRGAQEHSRKKFCSGHPANPHADCTAQGPVDCWTVIAERYGRPPEWRLKTPVSRGAIVDRLTDSGIPLGTNSPLPGDTDRADSYIPLADWKPRHDLHRHPRTGERPNLLVRAVLDGSPINDAMVTLHTAEGRRLYQGRTKPKRHPFEPMTGDGEVYIRGAHVGDRVEVVLARGLHLVKGAADVQSGAGPLVVPLSIVLPPFRLRSESRRAGSVDVIVDALDQALAAAPVPLPLVSMRIDGQEEPFILETERPANAADHRAVLPLADARSDGEIVVTVFDAGGHSTELAGELTAQRLLVDDDCTIASADGEVQIVLRRGGLALPAHVLIAQTVGGPLPPLGSHDALLVAPHRITSSSGDDLRLPALLHLTAGGESLPAETPEMLKSIELLELVEESATWRALRAHVHPRPLVASTSIRRLGTFALVQRGSS